MPGTRPVVTTELSLSPRLRHLLQFSVHGLNLQHRAFFISVRVNKVIREFLLLFERKLLIQPCAYLFSSQSVPCHPAADLCFLSARRENDPVEHPVPSCLNQYRRLDHSDPEGIRPRSFLHYLLLQTENCRM